MGTRKSRFEKVEWLRCNIREFFKKRPSDKIDKDRLLAEFALNNNSTERTGEEILRLLSKTGLIKIEGNSVILTKNLKP